MKIINILTHIPPKSIFEYEDPVEYQKIFLETDYVRIDKYPFWIGFFKVDWHHQWGRRVQQINQNIIIECWRPYGEVINTVYKKEVEGILHKVFPSECRKVKKVGHFTQSILMLQALKKEIQSKDVLIHFYGAHQSLTTWLLLKLKPRSTPVIIQQLGGPFDFFSYKKSGNILRLVPYFLEKRAFKFIDKYFTASKTEQAFLANHFKSLDFELFLNGINFSLYEPVNKTSAKETSGISPRKKMILYVGRYNSTKNVDNLIDAFIKIKQKHKNVILYLVGGFKEDEFYNKALKSGATIVERSDKSINKYFAAADVYVMPISNYNVKEFGGIGIAPLEALAMNTPVISENLKHCPGKQDEISMLGIFNLDYSKLDQHILDVIDNSWKYKNCRQVAQKYYDINENTNKLISIYKSLHTKHYGKV